MATKNKTKKQLTKKKQKTKKATTKKATAKKATTKKTATKKTATKKATTKKTAPKKTASNKSKTNKPTSKTVAKPSVTTEIVTAQWNEKSQHTGVIPEAKVKEGHAVPEIELVGTGDQTYHIPSGKAVVLFFYPKDCTPGCTIEGQDFTRLHGEFKNKNVEVLGISRDTLKSHENFKNKENYSVELLSDTEEKACNIFGVIKLKNMYGKTVRGIERSTFFIDEKGLLIKEWRGVKVPGHAEEVLEFVKNINK
ncbi:MAG: peroxiredoxin [Bdellovibrionaceae bacterium]|nr:peroxiredoxin [Pseudobdellovibrionaceae bacterium]